MTTFKTPGVYVQELSLFPPSVAEVATAVPAFIGYTGFAAAANGDSLKFQPVKIKSLLEFESLFGKEFTPGECKVFVKSAGSSHVIDKVTAGIRFYLYDALRLFYDNGGGECYIVSVGFFDEVWKYDEGTKVWSGTGISSADILKGLQLLTKFDEPTLLLFPDAAGIAGNDRFSLLGELQQAALAQASQLKDRFVIMDLMDGFLPAGPVFDPAETFRQYTGMNGLSYGAAYYPWLKMVKDADINWSQLSFRKLTGDVESAFDIDTALAADTVYGLYIARKNDLKSISDMIGLLKNGQASIGARLAALAADIAGTADDTILKAKLTEYFKVLSDLVLFLSQLETSAAADLKKVLTVLKADLALQEVIRKLVSLQKSNKVTAVLDNNTPAVVTATYGVFATPNPWTGNIKFSDITADATPYVAGEQAKVVTALVNAGIPARLEGVLLKLLEEATLLKSLGEKSLLESHPLFKSAVDQVKEMMRLVPPSGAVAGIYAATDNRRGVWKAPANISIASVIGPAVRIDNRDQESLNVHTTGKSINAIRCFTGKGPLVWGARTLAGNDGEWKYIPVRRFFNMVEESVKKASEPFTFEPNDKNTWVKVKAMIENYLILQWRAGALQGANPADAFFVHVGFGETMTAEDILEGRMIIEIGMAAVRPAEFIVLRFSHKMLEGNA